VPIKETEITFIYIYIYTVKPAEKGPPIYRKPGQTENKFRNGIISHVK